MVVRLYRLLVGVLSAFYYIYLCQFFFDFLCLDKSRLQNKLEFVAATCAYTRAIDHSLRAGYRSILVLTSLAYTRADQSERRLPPAPIRPPEW